MESLPLSTAAANVEIGTYYKEISVVINGNTLRVGEDPVLTSKIRRQLKLVVKEIGY